VLDSPLATPEQKRDAELALNEVEGEETIAIFDGCCAAMWWQPEIGEA
jgi:hypothetical protein